MREIGGLKIDSVVGSQSTIASMETNSREEEGSPEEPIQFNFFCIREYVAEVRRRDWMKCWPFNSGNSVTDKVLASQILEDDNALVNSIPEDTEAPNLLTASQVGNAEVHEPRSEIPTDEIIGDDAADGTINGGASAEATIRANDAQFQNETNITEVAIVAENDKPQDDNAAETNNTPSNSAAIKVNDAICQNETSFANDAIAAEIDGQQDTIIGNDAVNTLGDGSSELVSNKVKNAAQSQNETIVSDEDVIIASGNDKPEDGVLNNNGADAMIDGPSEPSTLEVRDARCQKGKNITEDSMASGKRKRRRNIGNAAVNTFGEGSSKLVSNKGKNVAQSQNENSISDDDDVIASGNDKHQDGVSNDDGPSELEVTDARCQNEQNIAEGSMAPRKGKRRRRNLSRRKPRKYRELADIYKQLGSSIYGSEDNVDSEFTSETSEDDDSDEVTLGTFIRGKRSVRANSKRIEALKNKRKAPEVAEPRLDRAKRSKSVRSEDNRPNDSELGSKYYMRKNRINELDLQMTNKRNEFSPDQDSLLSRGQKSNRETAQEERAREVLKPLDGNQRQEENHSRPSQGVKRAQHLVQPPVAISINDVGTASGCVHKRIRETSPPTGDYENMAVLQLLRLSNAGVNIGTSSETATEDPTLSVAKPNSPIGLDASRTATEDQTLSVANPKSSSGLDASKTTTEDPTLSVAKPKGPSGLDASRTATKDPKLSVAKPKNPSRLDASRTATEAPTLSVAKPKNPSGLDASRTATEAPTLSVAKPKNPRGLDASKHATKDPNLSVAKPKNPTWLDASKTATKDPTLSVAKPKIPSGLDGVVPPALGSMVSKPCVEVNVIDGAGLSHAVQTKSVSYICPISRNPAEFSIPKAKKFMRRGKAVKTV